MICAFCDKNKATKKNTHYLTDSVIRRSLNADGSNVREQGFLFDMSNDSLFPVFRFQRSTPIDKVEEQLGAPANDEEIEKAKELLFAVDDIFCPACEDVFTEIETPFLQDILPKLRSGEYNQNTQFILNSSFDIRLFFYLQFWRTSVCLEAVNLNEKTLGKLKYFLINRKAIKESELKEFPIKIDFLITDGEAKVVTENMVGATSNKNPYLLFMNDFIIQLFDSNEDVIYLELNGINSIIDFFQFINYNENEFKIRILEDSLRRGINSSWYMESKGKLLLEYIQFTFTNMFLIIRRKAPIQSDFKNFIEFAFNKDENFLSKGHKALREIIFDYFSSR